MKSVYLEGKRVLYDPQSPLAEGGEAEIFDLGQQIPGMVLKLWKPSTHADFQGSRSEDRLQREAVTRKLDELQSKMHEFPQNLPGRVIVPHKLATSRDGSRVIGYTMRRLRPSDPLRVFAQSGFRAQAQIDNNHVLETFRDLHQTVRGLHQRAVVIGDFNYLNVLVQSLQAWLIDSDSMQFGKYTGRSYTVRFVDPLICDARLKSLLQTGRPAESTDWYAYALMLFECLLLVHPYGGVYEPKRSSNRVPQDERPLRRISVLHPEVRYPVKGIPLAALPDELLQFYSQLLEKDWRGAFPLALLENLRWTRCSVCGTEHAHKRCPRCSTSLPPELLVEIVRGSISIRRLFQTGGAILRAAMQNGRLNWLYHEGGCYKRENGATVLRGALRPEMRYRLRGRDTVFAAPGQMMVLDANAAQSPRYPVDSYRGLTPVFDSNSRHVYWLSAGSLQRDDRFGPRPLGRVLGGQTRFWAGEQFGFGFYRAGGVQVAFVFDSDSPGINDSVTLPRLTGEILDATCYFSAERCWFVVALQDRGRVTNRCFLLSRDGNLITETQAAEGDPGWLGELRAKCAVTLKGAQGAVHCLFAVSEQGLVRLQEEQGQIVEGARFPDTKGLLSSDDALFFGREGLYLVSRREVRLLTIHTR